MNYRHLGNSGLQVSEIGLGGWLTVGAAQPKRVAAEVLDAAFELGINFLDTANAYAKGEAERVWGELLADRPRDDYVLATKVFFPMGERPNQSGLSRKHVFEQCHASLERLRVDHIDVYQCHRYDEKTPLEETVRAMDDLIKQGKVIYWGFSQWTPEQVRSCLDLCETEGFFSPRSSQPQYNAVSRGAEAELFPLCHDGGVGQVCYSPLAQGVLTGKYQPGQPLPGDSRANDDRQNQFIKNKVEDRDLLEKVQGLVPIAAEQGCTVGQLALAWALRRPEVSSLIVGASKPQQLRENAEASGIELDAETVGRIDAALE